MNILQIHNKCCADRVSVIKNWLGRQSLQFLETLTQAEQEASRNIEGLFEILSNKFKLQHNEIILFKYNILSYTGWTMKVLKI